MSDQVRKQNVGFLHDAAQLSFFRLKEKDGESVKHLKGKMEFVIP